MDCIGDELEALLPIFISESIGLSSARAGCLLGDEILLLSASGDD
jgi:hypothetical protein